MNGWKNVEDKKEWIEVKIRLPKNTIAFIVNYLEKCSNGTINMGNSPYDSKDLEKMTEEESNDC